MNSLKQMQGKQVCLIPTGNLVHRWSDKFITAEIIKVSRVFVTVKVHDLKTEKFRINGVNSITVNADGNAGYLVYETEQEVLDHHEAIVLRRQIQHQAEYKLDDVNITKLRKVLELLS